MADDANRMAPSEGITAVLSEIKAERERQILEGYTPKYDDGHTNEELADAAIAYIVRHSASAVSSEPADVIYPWSGGVPIQSTRREALVIAAALLVAAIERIDRMAPASEG